jgi:hypothetical protein
MRYIIKLITKNGSIGYRIKNTDFEFWGEGAMDKAIIKADELEGGY